MAIHHLAFFEALAELPDESCPEWRATSAGLLTLRFVDAWAYEKESLVKSDSWSMRTLRRTISEIDVRDSKRALLLNIVDTMREVKQPGMTVIAPRLMAYARALQFEAKWALAADVYSAVLRHIQPFEDSGLVIQAYMQTGACMRVLAKWDEALAAYSLAGDLAAVTGDVMDVLRARVAEANVLRDRGNLPQAERILDETIDSAEKAGLTEIRAIALHDRAAVAYNRRQFGNALEFAYTALGDTREQIARDRILADIATIFVELGLRSAARDANLVLAATAQEQYTRWIATISLLEIAAMDRMEPAFELYRRELAAADLPASLAAHYHYFVGRGYQMFGQFERARVALARAIDLASLHRVSEILVRAEDALKELDSGRVAASANTPEPTEDATRIAGAIREMRTLAGIAG